MLVNILNAKTNGKKKRKKKDLPQININLALSVILRPHDNIGIYLLPKLISTNSNPKR
jgi:hypothetical protein